MRSRSIRGPPRRAHGIRRCRRISRRSACLASNPTPPAASPTPGCWPTHSVSSSTRSSPCSSAADVPRRSNPRSRSRSGRRSSVAPIAGPNARGTLGGKAPLAIVSTSETRPARTGPGRPGPGDASTTRLLRARPAGPPLAHPGLPTLRPPPTGSRPRSRMGQHVRGAEGPGGRPPPRRRRPHPTRPPPASRPRGCRSSSATSS